MHRLYNAQLFLLACLTTLWALWVAGVQAQDKNQPKKGASPEEIVKKGGKYWSSVTKVNLAVGDDMTAGDRFTIWPAEDREYLLKDDTLTVKLHWRLVPGQKAPGPIGRAKDGKDDLVAYLAYRGYGRNFGNSGIWYSGVSDRRQIEIGAKEGTIVTVFKLKNPVAVLFSPEARPPAILDYDPGRGLSGKGEMYVSLSPMGLIARKNHSNILKVTVKVDR